MAKSSMENPAPPYSAGMNYLVKPARASRGTPPGRPGTLPPALRAVDLAGDRPEHSFGERPRVLLQLLLAVAQREIDGHDRHLLPVSFLSRYPFHAQPAAAVTIAPAFACPGDGINTLEHSRFLQFVAQVPEHLVLYGIASALASG